VRAPAYTWSLNQIKGGCVQAGVYKIMGRNPKLIVQCCWFIFYGEVEVADLESPPPGPPSPRPRKYPMAAWPCKKVCVAQLK
jgi:hypothetical protein